MQDFSVNESQTEAFTRSLVGVGYVWLYTVLVVMAIT